MGFIDFLKRLFLRRKLGKASKRMRAINASYKKDPDTFNEQISEGELGGAGVSLTAGAESKPDVDNFVADRTLNTRIIRADIPKNESAAATAQPEQVVYTEQDEKERMRELDGLTRAQNEERKPKTLPVTKYRKYPELEEELASKTKNINRKTMDERKQPSVDDTPVSVGLDAEPRAEEQPEEQDSRSVTVQMPEADKYPPEWAIAAQQREVRRQRDDVHTIEAGADRFVPADNLSEADTMPEQTQIKTQVPPGRRMSGVMALAEGRKAEEDIKITDTADTYKPDGTEAIGEVIPEEAADAVESGDGSVKPAEAAAEKYIEESEQTADFEETASKQVMDEAAAAVSVSQDAGSDIVKSGIPINKNQIQKQPRIKTAEQLKREQERAEARAKAAEQKKIETAKLNAEKAEQNRIERERVRAEKREADKLERIRLAAERKAEQQKEIETAAKQEKEEQTETLRAAQEGSEREARVNEDKEDELAVEAADTDNQAVEKEEADSVAAKRLAEEKETERFIEEQRKEREAEALRAEEERLAREAAIISRLIAEKADAERLAADRLVAERAEEARIAAERAEKDRIAKERAEAERLAGLEAEEERIAAERAEKARIAAQKRAEEKRFIKEQTDKERQEKAETARLERERIAAEKAEALRIEKEKAAAEKAEKERLAAIERERVAAEKAEALRIEKEKAVAEKAEKERLAAIERERIAAEKAEALRIEKEKAAALKAEEERLNKIKKEEEQRRAEENRLAEEASKAAMKKADEDAKAAGLEAKKKFSERKLPSKSESMIKDKAAKPAQKAAAPKIKPLEPATPSRDAQKISAPPKAKVQENEAGLRLLFQPVMFAPKQQICGYECLLRIYDAELGVIEPKIFLDIAQKDIRIIKKLEDWSFEELLDVSKKLKDKNLSMLSINISSRNFYEASFIDSVKKIMAQEKSVPTNIYMEFREDVLFSDPVTVETKFNILRGMGVKVAIDDFGKDYFTSATRPTFKLDMVKIGYGYIKDILVNTRSKSVVRAILAYAKEFKADVVAVGVETKEQEDALLKLGCKKMQGYLYSKPVKEQKMLSKK